MTGAVPSVGPYRTPDHKYYVDGAGPYPSVTTVLGVLDKPALVSWAKRETAECAIRNLDMLGDMVRTGGDRMAVEWLKQIPDYQRDTAANRGTRVHAAADAAVRGYEYDLGADEMPYLDAYRAFLGDHNVRIIAAELIVFGGFARGMPYGGTLDLIAELNWPEPFSPREYSPRRRALLDIKTSKGTYRETALQLAPYGLADFGMLEGKRDRFAIPPVDCYGVVHIRPELYPQDGGYKLVPYEVTPDTLDAFYAAYRLSQWLKGPNPKGTTNGR